MRKVSLSISLGILFTLALSHSPLIGSSASAKAASLAAPQGRSTIYGTDLRRCTPASLQMSTSNCLMTLIPPFAKIRRTRRGGFNLMAWLMGDTSIKIRPGNTGYLEHTQQVVISAISSISPSQGARSGGSDNQHVDIASIG